MNDLKQHGEFDAEMEDVTDTDIVVVERQDGKQFTIKGDILLSHLQRGFKIVDRKEGEKELSFMQGSAAPVGTDSGNTGNPPTTEQADADAGAQGPTKPAAASKKVAAKKAAPKKKAS